MDNIPLYQHIVNVLRMKIESGELKAGDKLPTEAELSEEYKVSRITSKRALTELENAQLINRIQGKGSFVNPAREAVTVVSKAARTNKEILLILPFSHNPGLGDYTKGIHAFLESTDYILNIQSNTCTSQRKLLDSAMHSSNLGLIFYPENSDSDLDLLYKLHISGYPTVIMDKQIEGIAFHCVLSDNYAGGYEAAKYLIHHHHKKIAFISSRGLQYSSPIRDRYFGYSRAMSDYQLADHIHATFPERLLTEVEGHEDNEQQYYIRFIQFIMANHITGVVAENDIIAIKIIQVAKELNYSIPNDFSIIGFDNNDLAQFVNPQLTTIAQDFNRMGFLAAKQLIEMIEDRSTQSRVETVPIQLIERQSVRTD